MIKLLSNHGIGSLLSSLCRGYKMSAKHVNVVKTKYNKEFLNFLKLKGYIFGYVLEGTSHYKVFLRYWRGYPLFTRFEIMSMSSRRLFLGKKSIEALRDSRTLLIFSTTKGLKTNYECLLEDLGGEFICKIYL